MKTRRQVLAALLALSTPLARAQKAAPTKTAERNVAGTVDVVEGTVTVQRPDKTRFTPKVGDTLHEGDAVGTGDDSELHINMTDGGYVAVRENTRMRIAQYQANGEAGDRSTLGLLEGGLRVVSGWIASFSPRAYQINAKTGTIGIRGTDHETHVRLKDEGDDEAGIYDRVYEGGTTITTKNGKVDVTPNRIGFFGNRQGARPMLLAANRAPRFFRARRNEKRFEGLHGRLQPKLKQLREERRAKLRDGARKR